MSKRILQHPDIPAEDEGIVAWRSAGELEQTPEFRKGLEREFPEGSGHLNEEGRELSRRNFTKLMGASTALSGLALVSCRRPEGYVVPYKNAPEWIIPGKPLFYATTMPRAEGAVPLVTTNFEGRPTKLEPNRTHPDGTGTDALVQASILDLYAPDRSREFLKGGKKCSREEFATALAALAKAPGKLAFVFGDDDCPTRHRLVKELGEKFAGAKFYSYEALRGAGQRAAYTAAFTEGAEVRVDFEKADRILSFDCDFLGIDPLGDAAAFSKRRQGGGADYKHEVDGAKMNRLYMVETSFSLTGGMADHRLRVAPSRVFRVAEAVARKVHRETKDAQLGALLSDITMFSAEEKKELFSGSSKDFDSWTDECATDLAEASKHGGAVVLAGSRHSEGLQRLVIAMNIALKAYGENTALTPVKTGRVGYGSIDTLVDDLNSGAVENVFLLGPSNPVYDTPGDLNFEKALKRAKTSIHLGTRTNASAWAATWHVPAAHYLESWSDARTASGVYSLVQPMILPLYDGVSELELLAHFSAWKDLGADETPVLVSGQSESLDDATGKTVYHPSVAHAEVRKTFESIGADAEGAWKEALQNGFVADSAYEAFDLGTGLVLDAAKTKAAFDAAFVEAAPTAEKPEIAFLADASVWDGRHIDNGWLQEAPDPISKLSWDNVAYVSPKTGKEMGLYKEEAVLSHPSTHKPEIDEGQNAAAPMVKITVGEAELEVPVLVAFGHAENCITISVGYGQGATDGRQGALKQRKNKPNVGLVGENSGFDVNPLRTKAQPFSATVKELTPLKGQSYPVALTQEHNAMFGRAIAREISTNTVPGKNKGDFDQQLEKVKKQGLDSHAPENISLYKRQGSKTWARNPETIKDLISDEIHQWGMSIDLNTCIGCNACMVACQAENNIPIVGKEQVAMGREMHWIRMDRYYATPKYERDSHGHVEHEEGDDHKKKEVPDWVSENPEMIPQPVACVQCENAPCETVCPVNATVHTEEGLNTMAYNRCIGTRYCANNCPYKARRFNYFDYNKRNPLIEKNLYKGPLGVTQVGEAPHLQRNPNVSVRMRGVMEKCTYCVQRLESAKIKQKQIGRLKTLDAGKSSVDVAVSKEDLRIGTDSVRSACQDACPTHAIAFGNLLDKNSEVVRAKAVKRNYDLLNYIGTVPRTSYLARVKNPNPAMPDAKYRGLATIHTV